MAQAIVDAVTYHVPPGHNILVRAAGEEGAPIQPYIKTPKRLRTPETPKAPLKSRRRLRMVEAPTRDENVSPGLTPLDNASFTSADLFGCSPGNGSVHSHSDWECCLCGEQPSKVDRDYLTNERDIDMDAFDEDTSVIAPRGIFFDTKYRVYLMCIYCQAVFHPACGQYEPAQIMASEIICDKCANE